MNLFKRVPAPAPRPVEHSTSTPNSDTIILSRQVNDARLARTRDLEQKLATAELRVLDLDRQLTAVIAERDCLVQMIGRAVRELTQENQ